MKLKTILTIALASCIGVGVTSCEDMLRVDSKTVMYDYQNTLDDPTDTVYSVLGIIKKIQAIADRTVILGEIRGDLVAVSDHASEDLRDLYNYDFQSIKSTNKYDQALDYYAIINNCNFYLNQVDTTYTRNQQHPVMKGEYIEVLCYRAWAYLQLAQVYGEVPYFDKPITGDVAANLNKLNIKELAQTLLLDFQGKEKNFIEYMDKYAPNYKLGGEDLGGGQKSTEHSSTEISIPVRLILGDLCLWAEDYAHAAIYYHDFLAGDDRAQTTSLACVTWMTDDFLYFGDDTYIRNIFGNSGYICYIPMETDEYSGIVSDLSNIYNSTADNYYWYQLTRSRALTATSVRQNYCYHSKIDGSRYQFPVYMENKEDESILLRRGDLRLQSVLETDYIIFDEDEINSGLYGSEYQTLNKINSEKIWLYRKDVVYLRLAEALNRCGLPQTAFAILKDGLCKANIDSLSQGEKLRARNINGVNISEIYNYSTTKFEKAQPTWYNTSFSSGTGVTTAYVMEWNTGNTFGIHSRGCGDASFDTLYTIGNKLAEMSAAGKLLGDALVDSMRAVEEYLIDEMALETCFEGYRFGDLLRIAQHRGADIGGDFENDFLARRVATRETAVLSDKVDYYRDMDMDLYTKLLGDGKSLNKSWFLVLPDEK